MIVLSSVSIQVEWYADETGYHPSAPFLPKNVVPNHPGDLFRFHFFTNRLCVKIGYLFKGPSLAKIHI